MRRSKGNRRNNNQNLTLVRAPKGFPTRMFMSHAYSETFTNASTTLQAYQFSCNGLYDPNITGTGHQPMYFDNMIAIYNHYTVLRSRIVLDIITGIDGVVALAIEDDTTGVSNINAAIELPTGRSVLIPAATFKATRLTLNWDARKYFGGNTFDNDNLQGNSASNPTEQSYYTFYYYPADGVSSLSVTVKAYIVYEAMWDELKTQSIN